VRDGEAPTLLLGLGNDILGDDAVGLVAARLLRNELQDDVEILESAGAGLELLDLLEGHERALLLDAVLTGEHPPGTVLEFSREHFQKVAGPSPHYAGIPEVLRLAECLGIAFPTELCILAMEVEDPYHIREGLSASVERALPLFVGRAKQILSRWGTQRRSLDPTSSSTYAPASM